MRRTVIGMVAVATAATAFVGASRLGAQGEPGADQQHAIAIPQKVQQEAQTIAQTRMEDLVVRETPVGPIPFPPNALSDAQTHLNERRAMRPDDALTQANGERAQRGIDQVVQGRTILETQARYLALSPAGSYEAANGNVEVYVVPVPADDPASFPYCDAYLSSPVTNANYRLGPPLSDIETGTVACVEFDRKAGLGVVLRFPKEFSMDQATAELALVNVVSGEA